MDPNIPANMFLTIENVMSSFMYTTGAGGASDVLNGVGSLDAVVLCPIPVVPLCGETVV